MKKKMKLSDFTTIEINSNKMSGQACLKGTRIPVSQIIAEIIDGNDIYSICEDYDLNCEQIKLFFKELNVLFLQ